MKKIIRASVAVAVLGAVAAGAFAVGTTDAGGELAIRRVHASNVTDLSDDRKLVGLAQDVFIGEVVGQLGLRLDVESMPETQFAVRVLETVKGSLSGTVIVNQQGGYASGELVLMEGDMLLEKGGRYLFATRPYSRLGWHTLVPGFGDLKITSAQQRDELRARFTAAREAQIPFAG